MLRCEKVLSILLGQDYFAREYCRNISPSDKRPRLSQTIRTQGWVVRVFQADATARRVAHWARLDERSRKIAGKMKRSSKIRIVWLCPDPYRLAIHKDSVRIPSCMRMFKAASPTNPAQLGSLPHEAENQGSVLRRSDSSAGNPS